MVYPIRREFSYSQLFTYPLRPKIIPHGEMPFAGNRPVPIIITIVVCPSPPPAPPCAPMRMDNPQIVCILPPKLVTLQTSVLGATAKYFINTYLGLMHMRN